MLPLSTLSETDHVLGFDQGLAEAVEDLAFLPFPHNGLHKGRGDCGNGPSALVSTVLLGEDLDCLLEGHDAYGIVRDPVVSLVDSVAGQGR